MVKSQCLCTNNNKNNYCTTTFIIHTWRSLRGFWLANNVCSAGNTVPIRISVSQEASWFPSTWSSFTFAFRDDADNLSTTASLFSVPADSEAGRDEYPFKLRCNSSTLQKKEEEVEKANNIKNLSKVVFFNFKRQGDATTALLKNGSIISTKALKSKVPNVVCRYGGRARLFCEQGSKQVGPVSFAPCSKCSGMV